MASWPCDAIFSQRKRGLKKPPKLPQQRQRDLQQPLYPNLRHIPEGGGLKCCEALLLSAHCSWTLFSSGKTTPSFHTWDVKEISHVDSPQGYGVRQIYLKHCKGLNASHLLRLVNLGWLVLDLRHYSATSVQGQRGIADGLKTKHIHGRGLSRWFLSGIYMVHIGYYKWAGTEKLGLWVWRLGGLD